MKSIDFKESNVVFAKDQLEYLPLPAWKSRDGKGTVISCWEVGLVERIKLLFTGKVWLRILTFNGLLQPQRVDTKYPFKRR